MEEYGEYHDRGITGAGYKTTKKKNQKRQKEIRMQPWIKNIQTNKVNKIQRIANKDSFNESHWED